MKNIDTRLSYYAGFVALCCLTHFATHLGPVKLEASWCLAALIIVVAALTLIRLTLTRFFLLLGLQVLHFLNDAPFNADHWLLQFLVNTALLISAASVWIRYGRLDTTEWFDQFAPAGRIVFLICYGFAAFCKYNDHFLSPEASCAAELAEIQLIVSPWLKYVTVPWIAGSLTIVCESAVPLLLIPDRTRRYGILLGIVFHTVLVLSPAIAVFDFSMMVFSMLFLFAPNDVGQRLERWHERFRRQTPAVAALGQRIWTSVLLLAPILIIGRTSLGYSMKGDAVVSTLRWFVFTLIAITIIWRAWAVLFRDAEKLDPLVRFRIAHPLHYVVISLAVLNGLCPYLGLKTQGSFTMFSNLRTEAGHWNHFFVPRSARIFGQFQDHVVEVAHINDERLQRDFVEPQYLVPAFEIQRAAANNPELAVTLVQDGEELKLSATALDAALGEPPSWIARKLLVFRPVTPDGSPYCGN